MKTMLLIVTLGLAFNSTADIWTFHGCKDNYSAVTWTDWGQPSTYLCMSWDWAWDQSGLGPIDSGTRILTSGGLDSGYSGYAETLTLDVPENFVFLTCMVTQGYPDYNGNWNNVTFPATPGEYWLDMDSTGTPRLSTSAPADFGKWAWDGSINPNWVEPLAAPSLPGKRLAKGHAK